MEEVAKQFLKDYYPEALRIPRHDEAPVWVDPKVLAERLGLKIVSHRILSDASIFGQLYMIDTDADVYDEDIEQTVTRRISGKTIVVDPMNFLLRNLGSWNNTIIHECVHWVRHRKVFELERLFNSSAACISCEVIGGAAASVAKKATEMMERQANALAPRIQMPAEPFRAKANEYIGKFMRQMDAKHTIDVMENVITALETDFCVSRQAAKIRFVELGFEEAVGTYTFLDNHYVKPHGFKKGSIT